MSFLLWLQDKHTPFGDVFFGGVTFLGDQIMVAVLMILLLWCGDRKLGLRLGAAFFAGGLCTQLLKLVFLVPRPWILEPGLVPDVLAASRATGYSFPSGHTFAASVLFGTLFFYVKRPALKALCVLAAFTAGFSRLYLLVHTLQDVSVSLVLGAVTAWAAWVLPERMAGRTWIKYGCYVFAVLLSLSLLGVILYRTAGGVNIDELDDAWMALGAACGFLPGVIMTQKLPYDGRVAWPIRAKRLLIGLAGAALLAPVFLIPFPDWFPVAALVYTPLTFWVAAGFPMLVCRKNKQ